jgi:hypothetical protein
MRIFAKCLTVAAAMLAAQGGAHAQIVLVGNAVQEHAGRSGDTYNGTIRVANTGRAAAEARVYLTDYHFTADGRTFYDTPGRLSRSNTRWITFTPSRLVIPAGGESTVAYSITVPSVGADSMGGTYWGMIMVEGVTPEEADKLSSANPGKVPSLSLQVGIRYGVQIVMQLPGGGLPSLEFQNPTMIPGVSGKELHVDFANSGATAYRPDIRLELYDEAGVLRLSTHSQRGLLYPGCSARQVFKLGDLPAGDYRAVVIADTGGDEVFGAQYRLKL